MLTQFPDLKNKNILVTGAIRGIGRGIAYALARQGSHVIFNFREGKESQAEEMAGKLHREGASQATPVCFDITQSEQIKRSLDTFIKEHGPIEGLVNNAGIAQDQLLLRMKEKDLTRILDTNLKGAIMVTQSLGRNFLRGKKVSIVNISSIVGLMGNAGQIAYAASKAGMIGMTKSLAKELGAKGIRCNAICPGFIQTDMTDGLNEETKAHYLSEIPLKRLGNTAEVAHLVSFLLSEASSYITGETIKIDGGLYI